MRKGGISRTCWRPAIIKAALSPEARCQVAAAHAEFISLLALNEIFFGERTGKAVRALQQADPWWEADSALKADLIAAMKADFYHEESPE